MPDLVNRFKVCTATQVVTEKLSHVSQSRTMPDLVNRFKVLQLSAVGKLTLYQVLQSDCVDSGAVFNLSWVQMLTIYSKYCHNL